MDSNDWSQEFNSFLSSALGKELIRSLKEDLHSGLIEKAQSADTQDVAFGLLKEASGVKLAIGHIMFLSSLPRNEEKRV